MHLLNSYESNGEVANASVDDIASTKVLKDGPQQPLTGTLRAITTPRLSISLTREDHEYSELTATILAWAVVVDRFIPDSCLKSSYRLSNCQEVELDTGTISLKRNTPISECLRNIHQISHENNGPTCEADICDGTQLSFKLISKDQAESVFPIALAFSSETISLSSTEPEPSYQLHAFADILASIVSGIASQGNLSALLAPSSRELETIWSWNATVPPKVEQCMHDIISATALSHPDKIAIHAWDGDLTYSELEAYSTRLAQKLTSTSLISVGSVIPLCFEKSLYASVAVLGVMKAGGAFVFISPAQPEERLNTILSEVNGSLIVSSAAQGDLVRKLAPNSTCLEVSQKLLAEEMSSQVSASTELPQVIPPDSPLYVIFTSGSTGVPKGVTVSHANYTSGALPRSAAVGYHSNSRVLDFAAYVFDVSIDCMLCTLAAGGTVCVPSEEDRMNGLGDAIAKLGVNMAHMTPSVARVLEPEVLDQLEVLGLGGEAVPARDAKVWGQRTKVVVAYGPSECTVGCTINNTVSEEKGVYASIGKGVGGCMWVVDPEDHDQLVPLGGVGELLIEGPIVGLGYLNRPELTEKVFINDPKWLLNGANQMQGRKGRLYKSGDLVSYALDGSGRITFVGRKDQQVKIRGQRVELAEIEHHLRSNLPPKTSVTVEVIRPGDGEPMLVAFVVEEGNKAKESKENDILSTFSLNMSECLSKADTMLSEALPSYMVPSAYIPLIEIPVLVSCKTDRKRLREIGKGMNRQQLARLRPSSPPSTTSEKPDTAKERLLKQLWAQVLGSDVEATRKDNFFRLGGDSLKAMRLVAAARKQGLRLTVVEVFLKPTLGDMAENAVPEDGANREYEEPELFSLLPPCWDKNSIKREVGQLCGIENDAVEDVYPCTPLQEGLMALSAKVKEAYVAQRVVLLKSEDVAVRLQQAFARTAEDCSILRTRIVQLPSRGLVQVVTRHSMPCKTGENLKSYLEQDYADPMELGTPLVRYAVVKDKSSGEMSFVLTIHHALYDGWSMPLIVTRLSAAYNLTPLRPTTPFKCFISYLSSQDRSASESYWRTYLDGASGPQFPQHPYSGYQTQADSLLEEYVSLPPSQSQPEITLATMIRGAFALLAARQLSISDVVFGETLTGRNAPIPGVESIEGPMIATVPARIRINRSISITEFLRGIHEQTIDRIPHEHFGLQHIRRLSLDAREACELKTGIVLHPAEDLKNAAGNGGGDNPSDGFVPAGDAEAAREALRFNTYALMLVCSLEKDGFLIMASFDGRTVERGVMERILKQLGRVVTKFWNSMEGTIEDVHGMMDEEELFKIWKISCNSVDGGDIKEQLGIQKGKELGSAWVVDPLNAEHLLPVGAVGEVMVECLEELNLAKIPTPTWMRAGYGGTPGRQTQLYSSGRMGRYTQQGALHLLGSVSSWTGQQRGPSKSPPAEARPRSHSGLDVASPKQQKLLPLWSRAIGVPELDISPYDSFFALGGDSIGAMKLVSEARHQGLEFTVAEVFRHKTLSALSEAAKDLSAPSSVVDTPNCSASETSDLPEQTASLPKSLLQETYRPFSALNLASVFAKFLSPQLSDPSWEIQDVLPTRPLQEIAIRGTIQNPKFSARYELFHFGGNVDIARLLSSCQELIHRNEILRTVFLEHGDGFLAVVLKDLKVQIDKFTIDIPDISTFARFWCQLDIQTTQHLGNSFVKFMLVVGSSGKACLVLRISHAQYDEMCLPLLYQELAGLYSGATSITASLTPYSTFVGHSVKTVPKGIGYWQQLLKGATWTELPWPEIPVPEARTPIAIEKTFDVSLRPKSVTVATLPTAAWVLALSRLTGKKDVMFGEVVTGRNTGLADGDTVVGPAWQYVPFRIQIGENWTGTQLLEDVQQHHVASSPYEGVSLREMVQAGCVEGWFPSWEDQVLSSNNADEPWFPTVVHQAVVGAGGLSFGGVVAETETIYPHLEPLREWKVQAFVSDGGDSLTLEIVTFVGWQGYAELVLEELEQALSDLIGRAEERI